MTQSRQELAADKARVVTWTSAAILAVIVAATYWPAMAVLVQRWWGDPNYVHGFLVPVFSAVLLWYRRAMLGGALAPNSSAEVRREIPTLPANASRGADRGTVALPLTESQGGALEHGNLWGLPLIAIAAAMRIASSYYYYDLLDPASLVPCLAGLTLFLGGWQALRWAWPSIVFLIFMIPLPGFLANLMGQPLQRLATIGSTYLIQTIGISAVAEGNVISLSSPPPIGVAEACNGLRNMMLFLAVCVGMVFISRRTAIEKTIIVLSSAAIALLANVVRITLTAVLHELLSQQAATTFYHDLAGVFMMPLAVVFLWLELAYLNRVFVTKTTTELEAT